MSYQHFLEENSGTTVNCCCSVTGKMDVSSLKSQNRNISQDIHLSNHTERDSSIQSPALFDGLCTVSESCQSSPENRNVKMCNGIEYHVNVPEVSIQVDSCNCKSVSNSDISEQHDLQLNVVDKPDVVDDRTLCTAAAVNSNLQKLGEVASSSVSDHCLDSLIRSKSFSDAASSDQLHVQCSATRKLAGSPKPVLRRHSMTFSRTKKQVTIETNAQVIEIDTGSLEYPEIDSASVVCTRADSDSDFSQMYVDTFSEYDDCLAEQTLLHDYDEVNRNSLSTENLHAETFSASHGAATELEEVPVGSTQKDINTSYTDMSPRAVELTAAHCWSYEVKCVEKSRVRHMVDDDDSDSYGDEADDESTANEEDLDSECKEEKEHKRKRRKSVEDEVEKVVSSSPNGRFLKFDYEIGCGSFKTVYKGLDSETGVHIAWCELQVSNWTLLL